MNPADADPMAGVSNDPAGRVVFLGASNLTRAMPTAVDMARQRCPAPLEVFMALGHGRSYGQASRMLGRQLPGIVECGIWKDLASRPPLPTWALVTDVGNDLLYGNKLTRIVAWIEACLDRLVELGAKIVVTSLPTAGIGKLSPLKYRLLRSFFFPRSRVTHQAATELAQALDEKLKKLALARRAEWIESRTHWFGWDPIHIRRRFKHEAWSAFVESWGAMAAARLTAPARWWYLRTRRPLARSIFGVPWGGPQPSGRLRDGSTIWLY